ncbi:hypothetical protein MKY84_01440 [Chryseomicrobium sp. FSL W7-1435]|uniref:hypothetical protein n=1 Tax=Chryseomicrobium sp. FSL W7-1435 TaxID=2921704 RepID=UPI00315A5D8B
MIELREMTIQEFEVYFQDKFKRYTEILSENPHEIGESPAVQAKKQLSNLLPQGLTTPRHWLFTVQVDEELAGYVWLKIEEECVSVRNLFIGSVPWKGCRYRSYESDRAST